MIQNNAYTIVYSFVVKEGKETDFIQNWKDMTELIYAYAGSLGSRLHKMEDNVFMAYAIWPDKATFDQAGEKLPESANEIRSKQQKCVDEVKIIFKSNVLVDLIRGEPSSEKLEK